MNETRARAAHRTPTGIAGLDSVTKGGLPEGGMTLLTGTAGSGKTVLGLQFLAAGANEFDQPGVVVTLAETPDALLANARGFGWGLDELVESGRIVIVDAIPASDAVVAGAFDFSGLSGRIRHAVGKVGAKRLLLDPVDALLAQFGGEVRVRNALSAVARDLRPLGVTTVMTAERTAEHDGISRLGYPEFIADNVMIVRNALEHESRRRTIEVLKFRGAEHQKGEYPFVINPGSGIEILPVSVIETVADASDERISLGEPALDEMCAGGIYRDSLVMVSGATGTGKTLMAVHFLSAGLSAGERALLWSFEESASQIARNARSWGVDLETPQREGQLKILSRYPARTGLEDLLVQIKHEVERLEPTRLVIDGLNTLAHNAPEKGFREFAVGLSSYLKSRKVATLMTTTREGLTNGGRATESYLSTVTDAIVILRYLDLEGELHRGIMILKLRGGPHDRAIHEYEIQDDGMHVLEPFSGVGGILAGAAEYIDAGSHQGAGEDEPGLP